MNEFYKNKLNDDISESEKVELLEALFDDDYIKENEFDSLAKIDDDSDL